MSSLNSALIANQLQLEAGRSAWEEQFRLQHLSVLSGEAAEVARRMAAATQDLRKGGEGAALALELLSGGSGGESAQEGTWRVGGEVRKIGRGWR